MINRLPRPAKTRSRSRDNSRQVVVVIAIGLTLALGALISGGYVAGAKRQTAAAAAAANDDDIYTGSILYMAYDGSACRQLLFDNQNGQSPTTVTSIASAPPIMGSTARSGGRPTASGSSAPGSAATNAVPNQLRRAPQNCWRITRLSLDFASGAAGFGVV